MQLPQDFQNHCSGHYSPLYQAPTGYVNKWKSISFIPNRVPVSSIFLPTVPWAYCGNARFSNVCSLSSSIVWKEGGNMTLEKDCTTTWSMYICCCHFCMLQKRTIPRCMQSLLVTWLHSCSVWWTIYGTTVFPTSLFHFSLLLTKMDNSYTGAAVLIMHGVISITKSFI